MTTIIPEPSHVKRDPGQLVEMAWDPITRIVGSLGIYTKIDFENREVVECHSTSSIFRGYSIFMKGKDPRDAHFITSRICGICGDNHATCSCYCQNMAYGVQPPHLGEWLIQVASCQDAREGWFVASRERARLVTGAGRPAWALLVARVKSWVVNAWIWRWVAAGLISE